MRTFWPLRTSDLNVLTFSPKDFLGSTDGDDFDEDGGSSMGAISGRGTPLTASSPTTTALNAGLFTVSAATSSMDFGNLLSSYDDVPGSGLTSNNALGDIMEAVEIPQVEIQLHTVFSIRVVVKSCIYPTLNFPQHFAYGCPFHEYSASKWHLSGLLKSYWTQSSLWGTKYTQIVEILRKLKVISLICLSAHVFALFIPRCI